MKHLFKPMGVLLKYMLGIMWIIYIHVTFVILCVLLFIWYFNFSFFLELQEEMSASFYIHRILGLERWRYLTISDFVHDNKCYTFKEF